MSNPNPLVGTWKLVSWEITRPDGRIDHPYGEDAVGFLIYTADGYMSAQIMSADRQQLEAGPLGDSGSAPSLTEADQARAYRTYLAYCGPYTVEGRTLIHHAETALPPSWTGTDQRRPFRFEREHLIIEHAGHRLIWERAAKRG